MEYYAVVGLRKDSLYEEMILFVQLFSNKAAAGLFAITKAKTILCVNDLVQTWDLQRNKVIQTLFIVSDDDNKKYVIYEY